jgi:hypothetical protein
MTVVRGGEVVSTCADPALKFGVSQLAKSTALVMISASSAVRAS